MHIHIYMNIYCLLPTAYCPVPCVWFADVARSTACRYSTRYTKNIHQILKSIGHRFVYQSGLDESPGQKSTKFRLRIEFRVYLMFSQVGKNTTY